ncbi:RICIN domain-containing protein [Streptomyces sp. PmtG]
MLTTGAVVTTAVAATAAAGLGSSAAQSPGKPGAPRPAARSAVQSSADIAQGGLYQVVSERYENLDLNGGQTGNGSRIQTWKPNETTAQTWRLWDAGEGNYLVETTAPGGDGKVLDADMSNGTANLWQLNGPNGKANQHWSLTSVGGGWFQVRNAAKGCLTAGAAAGDQVTLKDCSDDRAQLWCLKSAEPRSGPATEKGIRGEAARRIDANQAPARARAAQRARAAEPTNTDYLIVDAAPGQAPGRTGVTVHWIGPSHRNPYKEWDWIEIREGGSRVTWDWVCPKKEKHCDGANGATFIDTGDLPSGKKYTIKYWSNGGRASNGTLRAESEFVS